MIQIQSKICHHWSSPFSVWFSDVWWQELSLRYDETGGRITSVSCIHTCVRLLSLLSILQDLLFAWLWVNSVLWLLPVLVQNWPVLTVSGPP